jgi:hypothetical protein
MTLSLASYYPSKVQIMLILQQVQTVKWSTSIVTPVTHS